MYGWTGVILKVDLTERKLTRLRTADYNEQFIGGRGIGARLIYDELEPGTDPFDPANPLIFNLGPLTGTAIPGSGRVDVTAKSPLTHLRAKSNFGAYWGPELKFAGFDHLMITGCADRPVYLWIHDGEAEIRDGAALWGLDTRQTQLAIRRELGDPEIKTVCIGPAGERRVRFACLITETGDAAGRTGMGAVMGSKNLKAVAVRGTGGVRVAEPETLKSLALQVHAAIRESPAFAELSRYGVVREVKHMYNFSFFPVGYFEDVAWEPMVNEYGGEAFLQQYQLKNVGCFACPNRCMNFLAVPGIGMGVTSCEPWSGMTGGLWNTDLQVFWEANLLANLYGLDTTETTACIGLLMELYRHGIITEKDTDGIPMERGGRDAILGTIQKIARREGFGDLLAEGPGAAARHWGPAAEARVDLVKGLSPHAYEFRAYHGAGLMQAVGHRGDPLPLRASMMEVDWNRGQEWFQSVGKELYGHEESAIPTGYQGKALMTVISEHQERVPDSVGLCKWLYPMIVLQSLEYPVAVFRAVTGVEATEADLLRAGERIRNLERAFDVREGLRRAQDTLPKKFFTEPLKSGKFAGAVIDATLFEKMKDEYYTLRGWDLQTGIPGRARLEQLGLGDILADLVARGIPVA
jgi:aldehyde:ferredoxin oxidoreductase